MTTMVATAPSSTPKSSISTSRIPAIDVLRGAVMILMAVDHVRVFAGVPAWSTEPAVFLTRWITHFCAPVFAFLAGTSADLHGRRLASRAALSRWLVSRGLWIVLLELTVVRLSWTFNFDFRHYMLAGVLWMLGWCLVLMAALVHLPRSAIAMLGLATVVLSPAIGMASPAWVEALLAGPLGGLARILYFGGGITIGDVEAPNFVVLYSIVPWIGVMACGYAFGAVASMPQVRRRAVCVALGVASLVVFAVLRGFEIYGDHPWRAAAAESGIPTWMAFLNASKYPASLHFLLMTLGPAILMFPAVSRNDVPLLNAVAVFGRVPFFYYLLHIPLIHATALVIAAVRTPSSIGWLFENHPMRVGPVPDGYAWSLLLLYGVAALVVAALYLPCRAFARLKAERRHRWLSYL